MGGSPGDVVAHLGACPEECFFWKLHSGAELDLLIRRGNQRRGFELKLTSSPRVTPSMRSALEDLGLDELVVIMPEPSPTRWHRGFGPWRWLGCGRMCPLWGEAEKAGLSVPEDVAPVFRRSPYQSVI